MNLSIIFCNSIGKNKWGGGEKWMLNTAKGLKDLGHTVKVAVKKDSICSKNAMELGLDVINIPSTNLFQLTGVSKFKKYFSDNKVDVVIGCQNKDVRLLGKASKSVKDGPAIIGRQGVQLIKNKKRYKLLYTQLADGIITNSKSLKKIYDDFGWWDNSFVRVIYNGIQTPVDVKTFDLSTISSIHKDTKIILSAGRLSTQKGFEYLINSAIQAKKENKDWKYFIAGTGKEKTYLQNLIYENDLTNYVFLLGFQKSIFPLIKACDIFVLPSLYEGLPNVLLEAMLYQTPVIATPVNGTAELIEDNKTGYLVPVKNSNAIYQVLNEAFDNPDKTKEIAINGHEFVLKNFNLKHSVEEVNTFITEVVKKKNLNNE